MADLDPKVAKADRAFRAHLEAIADPKLRDECLKALDAELVSRSAREQQLRIAAREAVVERDETVRERQLPTDTTITFVIQLDVRPPHDPEPQWVDQFRLDNRDQALHEVEETFKEFGKLRGVRAIERVVTETTIVAAAGALQ